MRQYEPTPGTIPEASSLPSAKASSKRRPPRKATPEKHVAAGRPSPRRFSGAVSHANDTDPVAPSSAPSPPRLRPLLREEDYKTVWKKFERKRKNTTHTSYPSPTLHKEMRRGFRLPKGRYINLTSLGIFLTGPSMKLFKSENLPQQKDRPPS